MTKNNVNIYEDILVFVEDIDKKQKKIIFPVYNTYVISTTDISNELQPENYIDFKLKLRRVYFKRYVSG